MHHGHREKSVGRAPTTGSSFIVYDGLTVPFVVVYLAANRTVCTETGHANSRPNCRSHAGSTEQRASMQDERSRNGHSFLNTSERSSPDSRYTYTHLFCSVLFCSSAVLDPRVGHAWTYFLHLSLSSVILIDSSTGSPVHVLLLSIQAVRGLPRLRAPGIVPCIISFSRQLPCFLMV